MVAFCPGRFSTIAFYHHFPLTSGSLPPLWARSPAGLVFDPCHLSTPAFCIQFTWITRVLMYWPPPQQITTIDSEVVIHQGPLYQDTLYTTTGTMVELRSQFEIMCVFCYYTGKEWPLESTLGCWWPGSPNMAAIRYQDWGHPGQGTGHWHYYNINW